VIPFILTTTLSILVGLEAPGVATKKLLLPVPSPVALAATFISCLRPKATFADTKLILAFSLVYVT